MRTLTTMDNLGRSQITMVDDLTQLTQQVLDAYAATPDPRLRELLEALTRHLHAFAVETRLTPQEWRAGIDFLTATGHKCDSERQECLTPLIRANGEQIGRPQDGSPTLVRGVVTDLAGAPLPGATVDVWQSSGNGLYDTQDPDQPRFNLRGIFVTDASGYYEFRTVRPASYPIPTDGPVGSLLHATHRNHWRAAHIHAIVSAPGYRQVTTHVFDSQNPYLHSDAVFGVKDSLVRDFNPAGPADPSDVSYITEMNFVLSPAT